MEKKVKSDWWVVIRPDSWLMHASGAFSLDVLRRGRKSPSEEKFAV